MIREATLLLTCLLQLALCAREHKVHNIVLYPDRHSWCQTTAIKQVVASPGYESVTIDNNVCVGACYSYSIPRTQPAEPGELIGPYCDSCQPVETRCYHVTLRSDNKNADAPATVQKRVQIITNCSCMSCDTVQDKDCEDTSQNTLELPSDLFALLHPDASTNKTKPPSPEDVPELLNFSPPENNSGIHLTPSLVETDEERHQQNTKLINLLKSIQEEGEDSPNLSYDKDQLKQLLDIIENSKHELNDKNLVELINFVNIHNSEDLELDLSKLKEVLLTYKMNQELAERHRRFGLGNLEQGAKNNADIEADLQNLERENIGLSKSFGLEGSHYGLEPAQGSHIGMGLHDVRDENIVKQQSDSEEPRVAHHHLGEPQHIGLDLGHLVRGPHGSLAFAPDVKVEHKLNIEADMVKPNHEGLVLSYEDQPKAANKK